jgi:hypothetical protein
MIMSSVLDPTVLDKSNFRDKAYHDRIRAYFFGVRENGVIVTHDKSNLAREVAGSLSRLEQRYSQDLLILWEEILKNREQYFVDFPTPSGKLPSGTDPLINLLYCSKADCIPSYGDNVAKRKVVVEPDLILDMQNYLTSNFEKQRRYYLVDFPPIESHKQSALDDILGRVLKYSKSIRIYDQFIGQIGGNFEHFLQGIKYILTLWSKCSVFETSPKSVEIITRLPEFIYRDDIEEIINEKQERNDTATEMIKNRLLIPLKKEFHCSLKVIMLAEKSDNFHARHLYTERGILLVDYGFDLFKKGKPKYNIIKLDNSSKRNLDELRRCKGVEI